MHKTIIILSTLFSISSFAKVDLKQINSFDLVSNKEKNIVFTEENKYRVFYFLNSSCPCSKAHFDHLNELRGKYPKLSFVGFQSNINVRKKRQKNITISSI